MINLISKIRFQGCLQLVLPLMVGLASSVSFAQDANSPAGSPQKQSEKPVAAPVTATGLKAVVTIAPLRSFVEPFLPNGSTVTVLMAPGRSEHGYEFTPSDLAAVAGADVLVLNGLGLEPRIEEAAAKAVANKPGLQVIRFAEVVGLGGKQTEAHAHDHEESHEGHVHTEACEHDHAGPDVHLWLDPTLVEKLVPAVRSAFERSLDLRGKLTTDEKSRLEVAERGLLARVRDTDQDWQDRSKRIKGKSVVTHHNAFPRMAERYGFTIAAAIKPVEGSEPTPAEIMQVAKAIKESGTPAIFIEPQFSAVAAERIAKATGVKIGKLDPLGDGDWFKMMRENLNELVNTLDPQPTGTVPAATK